MDIRKLAVEIAKREGKKSQARIGDIREILSIMSDMVVEKPTAAFDMLLAIVDNGLKRQKKKGKKK